MLLTCLLEKAFGLNLILHKAKLTCQLGCDCIGVFRQINNLNTPLWLIQNKLCLRGEFSAALKATQVGLKTSYYHRNGNTVAGGQRISNVKR